MAHLAEGALLTVHSFGGDSEFDPNVVERICEVLADTSSGLTGSLLAPGWQCRAARDARRFPIHGEQLYHSTTRKFFTDWMANKKSETSPGTHKRYQNAVDKLILFLGDRADRDVAYIHKRDLTALRDKTALDLSASTASVSTIPVLQSGRWRIARRPMRPSVAPSQKRN